MAHEGIEGSGVSAISEIWDGRSLSHDMNEGVSEASRSFRIITNNRHIDGVVIQTAADESGRTLPQRGSAHPHNPNMRVSNVSITQSSDGPTFWEANVTYTDRTTNNFGDNPELDTAPVITCTTVEEQVDLLQGWSLTDDEPVPYANTLFEPYEGATKPEHYWQITVSLSLLRASEHSPAGGWPAFMVDIPNTINSKQFRVLGVPIPQDWARISELSISPELLLGTFHYFKVSVTILVRRGGWNRTEVNRGYHELHYYIGEQEDQKPWRKAHALDDHQQPVGRPVYLNKRGEQIKRKTDMVGLNATPEEFDALDAKFREEIHYQQFRIFERYDFTRLPHFSE